MVLGLVTSLISKPLHYFSVTFRLINIKLYVSKTDKRKDLQKNNKFKHSSAPHAGKYKCITQVHQTSELVSV